MMLCPKAGHELLGLESLHRARVSEVKRRRVHLKQRDFYGKDP